MNTSDIQFREQRDLPVEQVASLFAENRWLDLAADPPRLCRALEGSHAVVSAWDRDVLVGLANAISDGHLVVYFPYLLVRPVYQRHGIGSELLQRMSEKYLGFKQQVLVSEPEAVDFYAKHRFGRFTDATAFLKLPDA
ncbi:MAG: GNAT family N-acetyltransferase [Planctomycetota bacterium]